jgi:hypothetical protein
METLKKKVQARKLQLDAETVRHAEASTEPDILFAARGGRGGKGSGGNGLTQ